MLWSIHARMDRRGRAGGVRDGQRRVLKALALFPNRRFRRALNHGVAAAIEHRHLTSLAARTVIDVGANRGQFALLAAESFPEARILAFEPLSEAARGFARVLGGEPRIELHRVALGRREGRMPLNVTARDDCSSLLGITPAQLELAPGSQVVRTEWVEVAPLTRFLHQTEIVRPALLKIDVQGYEGEVLEGARPLLPHFDAVYVEASFRELYAGQTLVGRIFKLLQGEGFRLNQLCNLVCDHRSEPIQADFDFRRKPWRH